MYSPASPDIHVRSDLGLGWITEVVSAGIQVGSKLVGGGGDSMSSKEYYPAVKRGVLLCPGPFSIDSVARAIDATPSLRSEVDAVLSMDKAWTRRDLYGPLSSLTTRQKASALVNWAHGGRDCVAKPDESGSAAASSIIHRLGAATSAPTAPTAGWAPTEWSGSLPVPPPTGGTLRTTTGGDSGGPVIFGMRQRDLMIPLGIVAAGALYLTWQNR